MDLPISAVSVADPIPVCIELETGVNDKCAEYSVVSSDTSFLSNNDKSVENSRGDVSEFIGKQSSFLIVFRAFVV